MKRNRIRCIRITKIYFTTFLFYIFNYFIYFIINELTVRVHHIGTAGSSHLLHVLAGTFNRYGVLSMGAAYSSNRLQVFLYSINRFIKSTSTL